MFNLPGSEDFNVRPAYIDNQYFQMAASVTLCFQLPPDLAGVILGTIDPGPQLAPASLSAVLLEMITSLSSFQDLTNDFAPSS
jgi:hypothetical protein